MPGHTVHGVRVEAVVPAWMLADGEYVGLAVGDPVRTGFALAVIASAAGGPPTFGQSADRPGLTTVGGRTAAVARSTVLHSGPWVLVLLASGRVPGGVDLLLEGWLTVEPFLWVPDGELGRALPDGRATWTVARVRVIGDSADDIDRLPDESGVDPDAAYLLDLTR